MDKARILAEIKRTAEENGGAVLGQERFEKETGISSGVWRGKYWRAWSDAVKEAGFAPNRLTEAHSHEALIVCILRLARKLGRYPTQADLSMERQTDRSFPNKGAFINLGAFATRLELVREYAEQHAEYRDELKLLPAPEDTTEKRERKPESGELADGAVYMFKLGKHFKIGKTFSVPRRHREIALELPEKPDVIHVITTDDPSGIEAYWHNRFAAKRTNGEWFALTREDIRAFKRRKFM
jgi:hypothetical protein